MWSPVRWAPPVTMDLIGAASIFKEGTRINNQAAITTLSCMAWTLAHLFTAPHLWPLIPLSDCTHPAPVVPRPLLIHLDHQLVVWLTRGDQTLNARPHSSVPMCGKFEWNEARIEMQASGGWLVGGPRVACVGWGLWAEEGERNTLVVVEQLNVLLWDGRDAN